MKKISFILVVAALVFALVSCGEESKPDSAANTTANTADISSEFRSTGTARISETTASATSTTSTTTASTSSGQEAKAEPILIGKENDVDDPVPVFAYNEQTKKGNYIYVRRDAFIEYVNRGGHGDYFSLIDLVDMMAIPYYYNEASVFESNGLAVVTIENDPEDMQQGAYIQKAYIVDKKGAPMTDPHKGYFAIERIENNYLCYYSESRDAISSVDILDEQANLITTIKNSGYGYWETEFPYIITFPEPNRMFDLRAMSFIDHAPSDPQTAMYSTMHPIGGGYRAVSDFSEKGDVSQEAIQNLPQDAYKKAIYKDGALLSGYDFFVLNHVKDSVFFVYDGKEYYFYDALRRGKVFAHLTNKCIGNYKFEYLPGLLIGSNNFGEQLYITDREIAKNHNISRFDDEISFYYLNYNYSPSYTLFSQILTENRNAAEAINQDIMREAGGFYPAPQEIPYEIVPYMTYMFLMPDGKIGPYLRIRQSIYNHDYASDSDSYYTFFHYYDLRTGKKLTLDDWFTDKDLAISILIANADRKYRELYPKEESPVNADEFFRVDMWDHCIQFDEFGFYIIIRPEQIGADFEFTASREDLKLILKPEFHPFLD